MKTTILGCGRWGSFLAWYIESLEHEVLLFGPNDFIYQSLYKTRKNEYLALPSSIKMSCDLGEAVNFSDTIFISISSQGLDGFLKKVKKAGDISKKTIVLCMKGIEVATGRRLTEVAIDNGIDKNSVAVWVGPGHIQDFIRGVPNCMVIDSHNQELTKSLADGLKSRLIRFYYGGDIIGTEIGAATKNIMGIVAGLLDGAGFAALKGALMARGAREVARLIKKLGGSELSAYGLCHLGDYEATLFSKHSNNRAWGENRVKKGEFSKLAEGVATASATMMLANTLGVDMPITRAIDNMIKQNSDPYDIVGELFGRDIRKEF